MKKLLMFAAFAAVLCSCGSGGSKKANHEWVDLGLPSGLKWATCNIGASSPEEYGDYFAWGETSPKEEYRPTNSASYGSSDSKWDNIGGNPSYDAAAANWGGDWRLPTEKEFQELIDNCDWEWVTQNGYNGYKVTGPNGNSIFLPAAGWRAGADEYDVGWDGAYWSSTPLESYAHEDAYYLHFHGYKSYHSTGRHYRNRGHSVRPVLE